METKRISIGETLPETVDGFAEGDLFVVAPAGSVFEAQPSNGGWQGIDAGLLPIEADTRGHDGIGELQLIGDALPLGTYDADGPVVLAEIGIDQGRQPQHFILDGVEQPVGRGSGAVIQIGTNAPLQYTAKVLRSGSGYTADQIIYVKGADLGGTDPDNRLMIFIKSLVNPSTP